MKKLLYTSYAILVTTLILLLTSCSDNTNYAPGDTSVVQKDSVDNNIAPDSTVKRRGPGGNNKLN